MCLWRTYINLHREMRKAVFSAVTYACVKAPFWIGAMVSCKLSGYFNLQATAGEYVISTQKLLFPTHAKVRRLYLLWEWRAAITHQHPLHHQVKIHFTSALFLASQYPQMGSLPRDNLFLRSYPKSLTCRKSCQQFTWRGEKRARVPHEVLLWPILSLCFPFPIPLKNLRLRSFSRTPWLWFSDFPLNSISSALYLFLYIVPQNFCMLFYSMFTTSLLYFLSLGPRGETIMTDVIQPVTWD